MKSTLLHKTKNSVFLIGILLISSCGLFKARYFCDRDDAPKYKNCSEISPAHCEKHNWCYLEERDGGICDQSMKNDGGIYDTRDAGLCSNKVCVGEIQFCEDIDNEEECNSRFYECSWVPET